MSNCVVGSNGRGTPLGVVTENGVEGYNDLDCSSSFFRPHGGRASVPIPEKSAGPRATSTLHWWIVLKALDPKRPIREADIGSCLNTCLPVC
jgi:hypothetical protein